VAVATDLDAVDLALRAERDRGSVTLRALRV
jgi:hypothetical protein